MVFWGIVLLISVLTVVTIGLPILRRQSVQASATEKTNKSKLDLFLLGAVAVSPIIAASIYLKVGVPDSLSPNFATQQATVTNPSEAIANLPPEDRVAMIENMVSGLANRLSEDPSDIDGWRMLARSYAALGRTEETVAAFREVVTRDENAGPEDWRNYATAMLGARGPGPGPYGENFKDALVTLKGFNQDDPLALFYLGLVARDEGEPETALVHWQRLEDIIPEDAPIKEQLRSLIEETEGSTQSTDE